MNAISAIIFDLGGVILNIDISRTKKAFHELGFHQIDELFGLGHADSFFRDHENGRVSDDQFIERIVQMLGGSASEEQVIAAWNALLLDFPPSRIRFLEELRNRYRLFLFSNTNGIHHQAFSRLFREEYPGKTLDGLFEKAYYSHAAGFRKPDLQGYQQIVADNHLDPAATLFIDDARVNVDAAMAAGLQGIHLLPGKTIEELDL